MRPYEADDPLEEIVRELTLRIVTLRWTEFESVWEAAIRVCDRYELGKQKRASELVHGVLSRPSPVVSSAAEASAVDVHAQTQSPVRGSQGSHGCAPGAVPLSTTRRRDFSGC